MEENSQKEILLADGWQEIAGNWTKKDDKITHEAGVISTDPDKLYINGASAYDGYLRATIRILNEADGEKQGQLVFRYKNAQQYYFAGIGGWYKKFSIGKRVPEGWFGLAVLGPQDEVKLDTSFDIKVSFIGTKIELYIGGVRLLEVNDNSSPFLNGNVGLRTFKQNKVVFGEVNLWQEKPRSFVIMPFAEKYRSLYETFIKKLLTDLGLQAKRADEIFGTNPIIQDILENIQKSRLIIAFLTEANPNVLYEIGVAHTLKKDVIILTPDVNKLPFDIRYLRCIQYEDSLAGSEKLRRDLKLTVEQVLKG